MNRTLLVVVAILAGWTIAPSQSWGWPRVDGTWRATFTPLNYDEPSESFTWRLRPFCEFTGCSFLVRSSGRGRFVFRLNRATGIYRRKTGAGARAEWDCVRRDTGATLVRNGYFLRIEASLRVTARRADGKARTMRGLQHYYATPTGQARAAGCRREHQIDRVYVRRTTKPRR